MKWAYSKCTEFDSQVILERFHCTVYTIRSFTFCKRYIIDPIPKQKQRSIAYARGLARAKSDRAILAARMSDVGGHLARSEANRKLQYAPSDGRILCVRRQRTHGIRRLP